MGKPMHFSCDEAYRWVGIGWGKEAILWEKYEYQFRMFSAYDGFYCISHVMKYTLRWK